MSQDFVDKIATLSSVEFTEEGVKCAFPPVVQGGLKETLVVQDTGSARRRRDGSGSGNDCTVDKNGAPRADITKEDLTVRGY